MRKRGILLILTLLFFVNIMHVAYAEKLGDYNNDGCVTEKDYIGGEGYSGFSEHYNNGNILADLNKVDGVTMDDFFYFSELVNSDIGCVAGAVAVGGSGVGVEGEDEITTPTLIQTTSPTLQDAQEQTQDADGFQQTGEFQEEPLQEIPKTIPAGSSETIPEVTSEETPEIISEPEEKNIVMVASHPVLNGVAKEDEVILSWSRSEIIEEELTGRLVVNYITGNLVINRITGSIAFIDKIINWFKGLFGWKTKAARIDSGDSGGIYYKVYRIERFGNENLIGQMDDKECEERCVYKDKVDENGVYNYKVDACLNEICKSSNVVDVEVVFAGENGEDLEGTEQAASGIEPGLEKPSELTQPPLELAAGFTKTNQYYDDNEASCVASSVSAICSNENDCVDCGGKCVLNGQVLVYKGDYINYSNQYGCFNGKWDTCDDENDLGSLKPGLNGNSTFLCSSVNNHIEWVSCNKGEERQSYTLNGRKYECREDGWKEVSEFIVDAGAGEKLCNPVELFQEYANLIGNQEGMNSFKATKIVPCCQSINNDPGLAGKIDTETYVKYTNACRGVK